MTPVRRTRTVLALVTLLWSCLAPAVHAQLTFQATLDTAQQLPPPTSTLPNAGGMATFTFDNDTRALQYEITVHDLTGPPVAAGIYLGPPGALGSLILPLDELQLKGTAQLPIHPQALYDGSLYVVVNTLLNFAGEIRGQIRPSSGTSPNSPRCLELVTQIDPFDCVHGRLDDLSASVTTQVDVKRLRRSLLRAVRRAHQAVRKAAKSFDDGAEPDDDRFDAEEPARKRLGQALNALRKFEQKIDSSAATRSLSDAIRASLHDAAESVGAEISNLQDAI